MDVLTPHDIKGLANQVMEPERPEPHQSGPPGTGGASNPRWWHRTRQQRRRHGWIVLTWPILGAVAAVLWARHDGGDRAATVALVGFTPALAAPLAAAALGAWRSNSTTLRAATALIAGYFLVMMNPVSAVIGCGGQSTAGDITIYTANVLVGGGRPSEVADSILAESADVFLLQEVSDSFLQSLLADERMVRTYPYRSHPEDWGHAGRIIWSRWPLTDSTNESFVTSRLVSTTVQSPQGPFRLTNIHAQAPDNGPKIGPWKAQFAQLAEIDTLAPAVMAGDFNATGDHRPFRTLLDRGWTDVHEPKGCGFGATWPIDNRVPVPFYRLDHVLVTDHFEVRDLRFGRPGGSDHLPVITELQLSPDQLISRSTGSGP